VSDSRRVSGDFFGDYEKPTRASGKWWAAGRDHLLRRRLARPASHHVPPVRRRRDIAAAPSKRPRDTAGYRSGSPRLRRRISLACSARLASCSHGVRLVGRTPDHLRMPEPLSGLVVAPELTARHLRYRATEVCSGRMQLCRAVRIFALDWRRYL
jgi:hypothetical protein